MKSTGVLLPRTSSGVQPQKVHNGSFCGTFKDIKSKNNIQEILCRLRIRGGKNSSHTHKIGSWYLLRVFFIFEIFDEFPRLFELTVPPGTIRSLNCFSAEIVLKAETVFNHKKEHKPIT